MYRSLISEFIITLLALLKRLRTFYALLGASKYLSFGANLHLCSKVRLWAPDFIDIGNNVYIGKNTIIECNARIGNATLIANCVQLVGRHDHNYKQLGVPVRFSNWVGDIKPSDRVVESVDIGDDVWVGAGAILLAPLKVGKGAVIAAGAVVAKDVEPYSVVAGNPAVKISLRFNDSERVLHEKIMDSGEFVYDSRGLKYSVIKPGEKSEGYD